MLIFDHFPKTGGTSIRSALLNCFPRSCFNSSKDHVGFRYEDFKELPLHERNRFKCIMAHDGFRFSYLVPNPRVVTLVREPVSWIQSYYAYAKATPPWYEEHEDANRMGIIDYIETKQAWKIHGNYFRNDPNLGRRYELVGDQENLPMFINQLQSAFKIKLRVGRFNKGNYNHTASEIEKIRELMKPATKFYLSVKRSLKPRVALGKR